ncbi:MAG TPA: hemerythrin domain-containing protein [Gammaproteobacteria bacterium]
MAEETQNSAPRSEVATKMLEAAQAMRDKPKDAIALLKADHQEATDLYEKHSKAKTITERKLISSKLCLALSLHMRMEEELFYPAVKNALAGTARTKEKDELIVPEARLEHESLKKLIAEVEDAESDIDCQAHVKVMEEYTKHHVKEEEGTMFPRAKDCDLDLDDLGVQLLDLKIQLLQQVCDSPEEASTPSMLFEPPGRPLGGDRMGGRP